MADIFRTLIVPENQVILAREIAASFGQGGEGMWTTPLSASGQNPVTHYISSGYIPSNFSDLLPLQTWEFNNNQWVLVSSDLGDPVAVYEHATEAGVVTTQAAVDALFAVSDVTEQEPFNAMGRLGLKIINPSNDL